MHTKRFTAVILGAVFATGTLARASTPVGFSIDIASGVEDNWPKNGDVDFTSNGITTAIGDVDGDGLPDVAAAVPTPSGGASISLRHGWDGTIKGVATAAAAPVRFIATGTYSDGPFSSSRQVVVGPGPGGQSGVVQEYVWSATNPDGTPSAGNLIPGRSVAPFGNNYTGGIAVAAGDLDGDGLDELITVAQTPLPPINGVVQPRIQVFSTLGAKAGADGGYQAGIAISPPGSDSIGPINVAAGPLLGAAQGTVAKSQIVTTYSDPSTGATDLAVDQGATPVSFVDKFSTKTDVWVWGRSTLHSEGVIHRDLATRCCMADLDGDGTDEIILSGNDGTEPIVSILHVADVPDPDGTSTDLEVTSEDSIDINALLRAFPEADLPDLIFNPSVTSTVFSSANPAGLGVQPLIIPQDAGTLILTADLVPEPASITVFTLAALGILKRRRVR